MVNTAKTFRVRRAYQPSRVAAVSFHVSGGRVLLQSSRYSGTRIALQALRMQDLSSHTLSPVSGFTLWSIQGS